jgi:hypothetical protein
MANSASRFLAFFSTTDEHGLFQRNLSRRNLVKAEDAKQRRFDTNLASQVRHKMDAPSRVVRLRETRSRIDANPNALPAQQRESAFISSSILRVFASLR